jgi:23S rRNA (guanosine2251-2'-O)-methyltransferase
MVLRDTPMRIFGRHAVAAFLARDPANVASFWIQENRRDPVTKGLLDQASAAGAVIHQVPRKVLDDLVDGARHQGVVLQCRARVREGFQGDLPNLLDNLGESALLLVLDGVQDPHNLGACLRSADAAGVQAVIAPRDRAVGLTPAVRKVACGAAESLPFVQVVNLARTLRTLRAAGIRLIGADAAGPLSLYAADLTGPLALVLGGEEKGLRRLTREHCDLLVRIPMRGSVQSLNVSVAAGICLYEAYRQRAGASPGGFPLLLP